MKAPSFLKSSEKWTWNGIESGQVAGTQQMEKGHSPITFVQNYEGKLEETNTDTGRRYKLSDIN